MHRNPLINNLLIILLNINIEHFLTVFLDLDSLRSLTLTHKLPVENVQNTNQEHIDERAKYLEPQTKLFM
jgi:hypothetical protein